MKTLRRLFRRLTSWSTSTRDEELLRAEFEEHIAMQTAENLRAGLSPIEARRQALLKFGSVEGIKDAYRDQRGLPLLETLSRDARHAIRGLRRTPAFTAAVILTLALGIGANTAVFAVIDSILIQPLPYPQAEALVGVWHTAPGVPGCRDDRLYAVHVFHLPRGEQDLRIFRTVALRRRQRHRDCRSGTASSAPRDPWRAGRRGREAPPGPMVFARGRHAGLAQRR